MKLTPKQTLTDEEVKSGLRLMIAEGLAAEAMVTLTGGAFLVSMALLMGATNTQIGLLASLPTFTNLFQLLSIWLVRKFNNRRAVAVACGIFARIPLVIVGVLPFLVSADNFVTSLILLLFSITYSGLSRVRAGTPGSKTWCRPIRWGRIFRDGVFIRKR